MSQDTFVTERLAAGLARQAIRDWRDRVERDEARLLALVAHYFSSSKGVHRAARELHNILDPVAFRSLSKDFKRKGIRHAATLPKLRALDGTEYLAVEANLFAVDLGGFRRDARRLLVCIHPHALARMFLRMQTTELADVRAELEQCLYLSPALLDACGELQLRQIIIPTRHGQFRCDVRTDIGPPIALLAKTWLVSSPATPRDVNVLYSIATALNEWGESASEADHALLGLAITAPESLTSRVVEALRAHPWLTQPYTERPDHLSELWEAARRQASDDAV
jgi:hypothetical protein